MKPGALLTLQRLTFPDPVITTENSLYYSHSGSVHREKGGEDLIFGPGGAVGFDSYMNWLNLANWTGHCRVDGLWLSLCGAGDFTLAIRHTGPAGAETLREERVSLTAQGAVYDLGALLDHADPGLLSVHLTARGAGRFTEGAFLTRPAAGALPLRLAICITTFRRPDDVARTAARITGFLDGDGAPLLRAAGAEAHLFVIDNDQSLTLPPRAGLTLIPNPNLGGAGGFARGLAAAMDGGFSHALFMDDDARCETESFVRTIAFLRLAHSPRAAVAGAMIAETRPWVMWENGARFDRLCRPLWNGTDLRDRAAVARMELAAAGPKPPGFYGGWWYFAFPLAGLRHWPFPFFVRGDDISFSLANRFDTVTLGGVVSLQEDFSAKESPLTLYRDLRNHLHHHMVQPGMSLPPRATAVIAWRFLIRVLVRMHYDSAEALLDSWRDVMRGPAYFADNADMGARHAALASAIRDERWQETGALPPAAAPQPPGRIRVWAMKLTLNGHLVPLWSRIGGGATVPIALRGLIWPFLGQAQVVLTDAARGRRYVVRHDKRRAARIVARAMRLTLRWLWQGPALARDYRAAYGPMTARSFWQARFLPDAASGDTTCIAAESRQDGLR